MFVGTDKKDFYTLDSNVKGFETLEINYNHFFVVYLNDGEIKYLSCKDHGHAKVLFESALFQIAEYNARK